MSTEGRVNGKRHINEFKLGAVKRVTERSHSVTDVAQRMGIPTRSLHAGKANFGNPDHRSRLPDPAALCKRM
jgi:transposase